MFDKNEVTGLYAMYKAIEEKKVEFVNHGPFKSLEATHNGAEGYWLFEIADEPVFVPKFVLRILTSQATAPEQSEAAAPSEPAPVLLPIGWQDPDIQRRLNDIVGAVQSSDTRYVRVISKSKTGKQTTLARIGQGASADVVVKVIMGARRKTKERTVMAEVLKKNLKRTMARSFPAELINA